MPYVGVSERHIFFSFLGGIVLCLGCIGVLEVRAFSCLLRPVRVGSTVGQDSGVCSTILCSTVLHALQSGGYIMGGFIRVLSMNKFG